MKDYIDECKRHNAFLESLLIGRLEQIHANSNLALAGLDKINLDAESMRIVALQSLSRLEKKPSDELLKEADKIKRDKIQVSGKQGIDS